MPGEIRQLFVESPKRNSPFKTNEKFKISVYPDLFSLSLGSGAMKNSLSYLFYDFL